MSAPILWGTFWQHSKRVPRVLYSTLRCSQLHSSTQTTPGNSAPYPKPTGSGDARPRRASSRSRRLWTASGNFARYSSPRALSWYTALLWRPGRTNRFGFVYARMCSKAHSARAGPQASWTVSKPQSLRALRSWPSASLESTSCTLRHDPFGRCKPACTRTPIRQTTEFERWTSRRRFAQAPFAVRFRVGRILTVARPR